VEKTYSWCQQEEDCEEQKKSPKPGRGPGDLPTLFCWGAWRDQTHHEEALDLLDVCMDYFSLQSLFSKCFSSKATSLKSISFKCFSSKAKINLTLIIRRLCSH